MDGEIGAPLPNSPSSAMGGFAGGSVGIVPWILLDTDGQSAVRRRAARAFLALRERALTH